MESDQVVLTKPNKLNWIVTAPKKCQAWLTQSLRQGKTKTATRSAEQILITVLKGFSLYII